MLVLFATMTGNAESAAETIVKQLKQAGHEASISNIQDYSPEDLPGLNRTVLFVVSTWGDGEPPDEAVEFWDKLQELPEQALENLCFAVYALGDSGYDEFCGFGRNLDEELEKKGAIRIASRAEADIDYEEHIDAWVKEVHLAHQDEAFS